MVAAAAAAVAQILLIYREKFHIENLFSGIFLTEFGAGTAKYQNFSFVPFFNFHRNLKLR